MQPRGKPRADYADADVAACGHGAAFGGVVGRQSSVARRKCAGRSP
ncbi:MAG: hypothetical protein AVDCRST_MAG18-253 [uncultured Thermomicrobiales bacterium]|uniref:Uncharacterized protein n=1 Tax=uncultured Thermomicrobiales bacterium TaxID=1645740 RepID=A0A6J4UJ42_9BACT|nr:MAG: hypothetical protein AVDCRST_MAG18-253 [uncultured Thermomicrobiales bacterium]